MDALMIVARLVLAAALVAGGAATAAEPVVLRMATAAPDGSAWSREIRNFVRTVDDKTSGQVRIKVYFGGIAGDERQMSERIRREQLDGAFSGGVLCQELAPTMRLMRVPGLFQTRDELAFVLGSLHAQIDDEFRRAGFVNLGLFAIGPELVFSRRPLHSLDELRRARLWTWGEDPTLGPSLRAVGMNVVPAPLDAAGRMYDDGQLDGFVAPPITALAFQWSTRARYLLPLPLAGLSGCVVVAERAFDALPRDVQELVRGTAAHSLVHLDTLGRTQDAALLGQLFARQGLATTPVPMTLWQQFFEAAQAPREHLTELAPSSVLQRVLMLLADYRAEHGGAH
jgi:TRAP-type C4-dicarboxylate transport system substrate-binding protein